MNMPPPPPPPPVVNHSGIQVQPAYLILIVAFAAALLVIVAVMATWIVMSQQEQPEHQSTQQQGTSTLPPDHWAVPPASGQNSQPEGIWNVPQYGAEPAYGRYNSESEKPEINSDQRTMLPSSLYSTVEWPEYNRDAGPVDSAPTADYYRNRVLERQGKVD